MYNHAKVKRPKMDVSYTYTGISQIGNSNAESILNLYTKSTK